METTSHAGIPTFLVELEDAFSRAMVSNDVDRIARCITNDWILVTPEVVPVPRARILGVIGSGLLRHATVSKATTHARVVGDMAWVIGRGPNTGRFDGQPIAAHEYLTGIDRRVDGQWRCMLTHLTPARNALPTGPDPDPAEDA
jgi:ketosteroid isomerase-like protein